MHGERLRSYSRAGWFAEACTWVKARLMEVRNSSVVNAVKLQSGGQRTRTWCRNGRWKEVLREGYGEKRAQ